MSYLRPDFRHPNLPVNDIGFTKKDYEGSISTLCAGCGHDSISASIIQACFDLSIEPHRVAKLSGIGCSSKTPTYFLGNSHGFNSVHGRMPSVATGANLANRDLIYIGVSGDGDTASIGFGQFGHVVRRNLNMLYMVENNGCYGLTKGQDSATSDTGSQSKKGAENPYEPIDLVSMALQLGATFVARSFSGDKEQLIPLIKAAIAHSGFAFIDVISPCVTFNNNPKSTKNYDYVREHIEATSTVDFVPMKQEITTSYQQGTATEVTMHDGSVLRFNKLKQDWDPQDRFSAIAAVNDATKRGEILTGLLYVDPQSQDLHEIINTVRKPLNSLTEKDLCPGNVALQKINESLR
jgi:2-oxoglutarate ferredoxin oxidoreductase subunit beta